MVYVRQSTVVQVREHAESTSRQYGLSGLAAEMGWPAEQIVIIDADLGISGRFGAERGGFRELVSRVCLGEVGAVFGLEVSRLARSSAELTRLLELARLTDTLLIDADADGASPGNRHPGDLPTEGRPLVPAQTDEASGNLTCADPARRHPARTAATR